MIQRELEEVGISTVGISIAKDISLKVKPPRTYFLKYPFGHPFGEPGKSKQHLTIFKDCLGLLTEITQPGTLIESTYRWRRTKFD
ncbi:MAG: hypothetical protein COB67_01865 [SAR324 cluster bacterium]|uniref:Uncharacterized protein n=1 Tax=SAR324 cluster bacterium TaxID=2024889 RepID=A0A2A4TA54_9DELT|nr:MAG: hypothetical protein COB67_01865 [SAR324 cluster bacterium]